MSDKQSKADSLIEVAVSISIGFVVGLVAQSIWFPLIGKDFSFNENMATTAFFTFIGITRSYFVRRLFNGKPIYQTIKKHFNKTAS